MKKELIVQVLLMVVLFYTGLHLYEQQTSVLEGLRPGRDTYDWAGMVFSITSLVVVVFSIWVGFKEMAINKIGGVLLIGLSIAAGFHSITVLVSAPIETMGEILFYFKYYLVLGLWLSVYLFFAQVDTELKSEQE